MKRIVRLSEAMKVCGLSRASLYRLERDGIFPRRIKIAPNAIGWLESELEEWVVSRASLRSKGDLSKNARTP